jgi:hypothetical protein
VELTETTSWSVLDHDTFGAGDVPDPLVIVAVAWTEVPEGIVTKGAVTERVEGPVLEPPPPQPTRTADKGISKADCARIAFSFFAATPLHCENGD